MAKRTNARTPPQAPAVRANDQHKREWDRRVQTGERDRIAAQAKAERDGDRFNRSPNAPRTPLTAEEALAADRGEPSDAYDRWP